MVSVKTQGLLSSPPNVSSLPACVCVCVYIVSGFIMLMGRMRAEGSSENESAGDTERNREGEDAGRLSRLSVGAKTLSFTKRVNKRER